MDDRRWGFEEADDWDYEQSTSEPAADEAEETVLGSDPDRIIEVIVTRNAEVRAVRLSPQWRSSVDPRALEHSVLAAANAATMQALAKNVEDLQTADPPENTTPASHDLEQLTAVGVQRLLDSASHELERFTEQLSSVVDRPVQLESAGGHVQGTAQRGQVLELTVDVHWATQARHTEIESELVDILRRLHASSTPNELAAGPQGSAISELMELARDPQRLMRRLGMPG